MNIRQAIKSAIVSMLTAKNSLDEYPTLACERVHKNRIPPLLDENEENPLPAIVIYILKEAAKVLDIETNQITSTVMIECIAEGEYFDEYIDLMSNQVEYLFNQNQTLDGTVSSFQYKGGDLGVDPDSNSDIVAWKMEYEVVYNSETVADSSETSPLLSTFGSADVDYGHGTTDRIILH